MAGVQFDFSGKAVVVTGASRGIGRGIAEAFAKAQARLILGYRTNEAGAREVLALAAEHGAKAVCVAADVTRRSGFEALIEASMASFGGIDVLVNNAGVYPLHGMLDMSDEAWSEVVQSNLRSVFLGTQLAGRQMKEAGEGAIVNVASIEGLAPAPAHSHYSAAKAGVLMHTRAAALELGPHGIRVNAVSPGLIGYPELEALWPDGVARYRAAAPLGRVGHRDEVADCVLFLASPAARFVTGANLVVDGGVSATPFF